MSTSNQGLSICICCHNSANRIEPTLEHLQNQFFTKKINWEVLLIDNCSSDNTSERAAATWHKNPIAPFKIIQEPSLGLSHARKRSLREAQYNIIGFIDDDNWADPEWVEHVLDNFEQHPEIAACSGRVLPHCEIKPPNWFDSYKGNYATWDLYERAQYADHPLGGAGLCLKKVAVENLFKQGFEFILSDRKGKSLSSGGDFELGYALLLNGWKLLYDPRLTIHHFIPKERLSWNYFIRLQEGFGIQSAHLEHYEEIYQSALNRKSPIKKSLLKEISKCCYHILRHAYKGFNPKKNEGSINAILWAQQFSRLKELLRQGNKYTEEFEHILNAPWISLK